MCPQKLVFPIRDAMHRQKTMYTIWDRLLLFCLSIKKTLHSTLQTHAYVHHSQIWWMTHIYNLYFYHLYLKLMASTWKHFGFSNVLLASAKQKLVRQRASIISCWYSSSNKPIKDIKAFKSIYESVQKHTKVYKSVLEAYNAFIDI